MSFLSDLITYPVAVVFDKFVWQISVYEREAAIARRIYRASHS